MNNTLFNIIMLSGIVLTLVTIFLLVIFVIRIIIRTIKRNKKFPKYNLQSLLTCGILSSVFFLNWIYNPNFLPKGFLNETLPSEDGNYEARVYNYSGFINYKNVRVEIYNRNTHDSKTIYYNFVDGPLHMSWIDENTIKIENKTLDVKKETYDMRRDKDK
ncbi:DUF5412 family protein [Lysinibacillus xylanilyticus]|uniref:DUF5412 family protein n=1 Tax=Lysinibacillus xylanilyticus TaxID=582475 RepID=UPI003D990CCA